MINKKILSLVLALMLVIGCMLSATSCMYAIDILTDPGAANTGDTDSDGGKTPESDGTNPPASNTGSEGQGDGGSEGDTPAQMIQAILTGLPPRCVLCFLPLR